MTMALPAGEMMEKILRWVMRNSEDCEPLTADREGTPWTDAQAAAASVCGMVCARAHLGVRAEEASGCLWS